MSYQQRGDSRTSGIAAAETNQQHRRHDAALSRLQNVYSVKGDSDDQKPYSKFIGVTSEDFEGVAQPDAPCTPKKKRMPIFWHGLPSPETPTFHRDVGTSTSTVSAQDELSWQTSLKETKVDIETTLNKAKDTTNQFSVPAQSPMDLEEANEDDSKPMISQSPDVDTRADARLARQLEESLSPMATRRSTRLRTQPKPSCKSCTP